MSEPEPEFDFKKVTLRYLRGLAWSAAGTSDPKKLLWIADEVKVNLENSRRFGMLTTDILAFRDLDSGCRSLARKLAA